MKPIDENEAVEETADESTEADVETSEVEETILITKLSDISDSTDAGYDAAVAGGETSEDETVEDETSETDDRDSSEIYDEVPSETSEMTDSDTEEITEISNELATEPSPELNASMISGEDSNEENETSTDEEK